MDGYDSQLFKTCWTPWAARVLSLPIGVLLCLCPSQVLSQSQASKSGVVRIKAGTLVDDPLAKRWNRIVLLAKPEISSGATDALPSSIRSAVSTLILSILATVDSYQDASGAVRYRLTEVGVGYSCGVNGQLKIVNVEEARSVGAKLSFIQRQLLAENEKQLDQVQLIARTATLVMFDTPAILLRDNQHKDFVMRHFVWIDSTTGDSAALVWLLEATPRGGPLSVVDDPMAWLPAGTRENRAIHVDGNEFSFLGIPTDRAFALEDLPPGQPVAWTSAAKQIAGRSTYNLDELQQLTIALNQALHSPKGSYSSLGEE